MKTIRLDTSWFVFGREGNREETLRDRLNETGWDGWRVIERDESDGGEILPTLTNGKSEIGLSDLVATEQARRALRSVVRPKQWILMDADTLVCYHEEEGTIFLTAHRLPAYVYRELCCTNPDRIRFGFATATSTAVASAGKGDPYSEIPVRYGDRETTFDVRDVSALFYKVLLTNHPEYKHPESYRRALISSDEKPPWKTSERHRILVLPLPRPAEDVRFREVAMRSVDFTPEARKRLLPLQPGESGAFLLGEPVVRDRNGEETILKPSEVLTAAAYRKMYADLGWKNARDFRKCMDAVYRFVRCPVVRDDLADGEVDFHFQAPFP